MKRIVLVLLILAALSIPSVSAQDDLFEAELNYFAQMGVMNAVALQAFQYAGETTDFPEPANPEWVARFASVWAIFEVLQRSLGSIDVPPSFAGSFGYYEQAIGAMADNATYCRGGFAVMDMGVIEACTGFIGQST